MGSVLDKLAGGDLRSIGRADEVVSDVLADPRLFDEVFRGMQSDDPVIRMRAADVIEKVAQRHPEYLQPYKDKLLGEISAIDQQEVRWHVALMFSYLSLTDAEKEQAAELLVSWLKTGKSRIVKVNALETLAHFAETDQKYAAMVTELLTEATESGSPAMAARARKLLARLQKKKQNPPQA